MNEHALRVLEYDKVKSIVAAYAVSEAGRLLVKELQPAADEQRVETLLRETREFIQILSGGEVPPFDGISEVAQAAEKLRVSGMMLTPVELLNMAATLAAGRRVKNFFQRFEGKGAEARPAAPLLCARKPRMPFLPPSMIKQK